MSELAVILGDGFPEVIWNYTIFSSAQAHTHKGTQNIGFDLQEKRLVILLTLDTSTLLIDF